MELPIDTDVGESEFEPNTDVNNDEQIDDDVLGVNQFEDSDIPVNINIETDYNTNEPYLINAKGQLKKPCSAYIIYLTEQRDSVVKEFPYLTFKDIPKVISERFKALKPDERQYYDDLSRKQKERYQKAVEQKKVDNADWTPSMDNFMPKDSPNQLILPVARIKRILKLDNDVKAISKEATIAITKATELFIGYLCMRSQQALIRRKAKALRDTDLFHSIHTIETLHFLRLDFPRSFNEVTKTSKTKPILQQSAPLQQEKVDTNNSAGSIKSFFTSVKDSANLIANAVVTTCEEIDAIQDSS